jgi:hypothetical protein
MHSSLGVVSDGSFWTSGRSLDQVLDVPQHAGDDPACRGAIDQPAKIRRGADDVGGVEFIEGISSRALPAQRCRHPAQQRLTRPGERDQERAEMVHDQMLQPVQDEHVLRHVFEMGQQHRIDQHDTKDERDLTPRIRPLQRRRERDAPRVPPKRQDSREELSPGEFPGRPGQEAGRMRRT